MAGRWLSLKTLHKLMYVAILGGLLVIGAVFLILATHHLM